MIKIKIDIHCGYFVLIMYLRKRNIYTLFKISLLLKYIQNVKYNFTGIGFFLQYNFTYQLFLLKMLIFKVLWQIVFERGIQEGTLYMLGAHLYFHDRMLNNLKFIHVMVDCTFFTNYMYYRNTFPFFLIT